MNKKILVSSIVAFTLLISGSALAAAIKTPAQSLSDLTGIAADELYEQRVEGKTYGEIAEENGVLGEFKNQMLQNKFAIIDQRVEEGVITEEEAEVMKEAIEDRMANCDGTPDGDRPRLGQRFGGGMRLGCGMGKGTGQGTGFRGGMGYGQGRNFRNK